MFSWLFNVFSSTLVFLGEGCKATKASKSTKKSSRTLVAFCACKTTAHYVIIYQFLTLGLQL